jgi:hypothetical protein
MLTMYRLVSTLEVEESGKGRSVEEVSRTEEFESGRMQGPPCGEKGTAGGKVLGYSGWKCLVFAVECGAARQQARVRQGEQRLVV